MTEGALTLFRLLDFVEFIFTGITGILRVI